MKKIFIITAILVFGLSTLSIAAVTFNENGPASTIQVGTNNVDILNQFKTSNNVQIHCASSAQSYAARSAHTNGDREYGTASDDPKIYWQSKSKGDDASDPGASDSSEFSSWPAL